MENTFNLELYRLGTFRNLSRHFPVSPLRLAQAGFLRQEDSSIVCHFCQLVRNEWSSQDVPMEVHRELCPDCPLVTGVDCDNVSVADSQPAAERLEEIMQRWRAGLGTSHQADMTERRTSYASSRHLSARGSSSASETAQVYLSGVVASRSASAADQHIPGQPSGGGGGVGEEGGGGIGRREGEEEGQGEERGGRGREGGEEHHHHQPPRMDLMARARSPASLDRPRILNHTAQLEPRSSTLQARPREGAQVVTYAQLGIITDNPQRPDMALLPTRFATFQDRWPETLVPTPLRLAEAGFYYAGYSDRVRCFSCGGGMRNWSPTNDPWVAHARRFPTCAYVRQCQGQTFVDVVRELHSENETQSISMDKVRREIDRRYPGAGHILDLSTDPAVCSAVYVGYDQQTVEHAARRLLAEGHQLTVSRLMDYVEEDRAQPAAVDEKKLPDASANDIEVEIDSLQGENTALRQSGQCKVCMDKEAAIIFLPCGHLVTCITCAPVLSTCPICRLSIKGTVRAFRD